MKKYFDSLINTSGAPVVAASISVYNYGTTTLASLFADAAGATTLANPLTSSSAGYFEFYAADGRYTLSISVGGYPVTTISDILLDDPTNASATVVVGGSVDNSPIGASTPSSGRFTTLTSTGDASIGGHVYVPSGKNLAVSGTTAGSIGVTGGTSFSSDGSSIALRGSTASYNGWGMEFYAGGSERMRIDSSGNVGLGISPSSRLDIGSTSATVVDFKLRNSINTAVTYVNSDGSVVINGINAYPMVFATSGVERMRIDSSGNVGIGAAPTYDLDISKPKTGTALVSRVYNAGTGAGSEASLRVVQGTVSGTISAQGDSALHIGASSNHPVLFLQNSVEVLRIGTTKEVLVTNPAGIGYGTGSGGTVTQATSKSTAVTLNKPTGQITMNNAALASLATASFTLNNSLLAATDGITLTVKGGTTSGAYQVWADTMSPGACNIWVKNLTGGSLSEAIVINFQINKGAAA